MRQLNANDEIYFEKKGHLTIIKLIRRSKFANSYQVKDNKGILYFYKEFADILEINNMPNRISEYVDYQNRLIKSLESKNLKNRIVHVIGAQYTEDKSLYCQLQYWYAADQYPELNVYFSTTKSGNALDTFLEQLDVAKQLAEILLELHKGNNNEVNKTYRDSRGRLNDVTKAIIHRDLRPENVLIKKEKNGKLTVLLADFDRSVQLQDGQISEPKISNDSIEKLYYKSPDYIRLKSANYSDDVYSLGIILYGLLLPLDNVFTRILEDGELSNYTPETLLKVKEKFVDLFPPILGEMNIPFVSDNLLAKIFNCVQPGANDSTLKDLTEAITENQQYPVVSQLKELPEKFGWLDSYEKSFDNWMTGAKEIATRRNERTKENNSNLKELSLQTDANLIAKNAELSAELTGMSKMHTTYERIIKGILSELDPLINQVKERLTSFQRNFKPTSQSCINELRAYSNNLFDTFNGKMDQFELDIDEEERRFNTDSSRAEATIKNIQNEIDRIEVRFSNEKNEKKARMDANYAEALAGFKEESGRNWKQHTDESAEVARSLQSEKKDEVYNLLSDAYSFFQEQFQTNWKCPKEHITLSSFNESAEDKICSQGVIYLSSNSIDGKDVYFVGDLHGDWVSLLKVLRVTNFFTSERTTLIFLGDYGDRGTATLKLFLAVLYLQLQYKDRIFLLRGNHEELSMKDDGYCKSSTTNIEYSLGVNLILKELFKDEEKSKSVLNYVIGIMDSLPNIIFFEDGLMVTHGFILPHIPDLNDRECLKGTPTDEQRNQFSLLGIEDLSTKQIAKKMRWQRFEGKEELNFVWPNNFKESDTIDWDKFGMLIGVKRVVRGHDPVAEGFKIYDNSPDILTLCTATTLSMDVKPAIALYQKNRMPEKVSIDS